MEERLRKIELLLQDTLKGKSANSVNQEEINEMVLQTLELQSKKMDSSYDTRVFQHWPDKKLRSFEFQEQYDRYVKMGRIVMGVQLAFQKIRNFWRCSNH